MVSLEPDKTKSDSVEGLGFEVSNTDSIIRLNSELSNTSSETRLDSGNGKEKI